MVPVVLPNFDKNILVQLLRQLCEIPGPSGSETEIRAFILARVRREMKKWKTQPLIIEGENFQDCFLLQFGKPRTAVFVHMDTVGFMVRYFNQLLPIGSPDAEMGARLLGRDRLGSIECELEFDKENRAFYRFGRAIERGTPLTYKVDFRESRTFIESAYLDNRLGIYNALILCETLKDGVIAFSTWEEHGGGSVPYLARYIHETLGVRQALISDITWVSDGVEPGKGVVISIRDRNIPRKSYVDRIRGIADRSKIPYQLEVEGSGSSDGRELQHSPYPFDWCFVGAPHQNPHTPHEKVHKKDIESMIQLYAALMKEL